MSKKKSTRRHSTVHWYNRDYWLQNGFLLPERAYSALCELINLGRYGSLDEAIRAGIRTVIEENSALLVRSNSKWVNDLSHLDETFKDPSCERPDNAGAENLRLLDKMYEAIHKSENGA